MPLLLGIDLGTSYFKVGLFDATGAVHGLGRVAVEKQSPLPGRSELPVSEFWRLLRAGLNEALAQANARASDIVGVSYSSQANTMVLLDNDDTPLTPLIIWNDQRAAPSGLEVDAYSRTNEFHRATGFAGLTAEFAVVKWRWYQAHEPEVWARSAKVMTLADYFTYMLTGERVGDASTAALTGLYSTADREWWPKAREYFAVPFSALSQPLRPGTPGLWTTGRAPELLGLRPRVCFAVGGLDHYMAALGSGIGRLADASISTGTVLSALTLVDEIAEVAGCYHGPHFDGRFYRLSFDPAGAGQLEEYQRQSAPHLSVTELVTLASALPSAISLTTLPGEDDDSRHGLIIRGIMERISEIQRTLLHRLNDRHDFSRVIATGGGARSNYWLQINANILNATIIAPRCHERACLGAAAFAAVAAGLFPNISQALDAMVHSDRVVEPQSAGVALYADLRSRLRQPQ